MFRWWKNFLWTLRRYPWKIDNILFNVVVPGVMLLLVTSFISLVLTARHPFLALLSLIALGSAVALIPILGLAGFILDKLQESFYKYLK